jgi:hypothetical protein
MYPATFTGSAGKTVTGEDQEREEWMVPAVGELGLAL